MDADYAAADTYVCGWMCVPEHYGNFPCLFFASLTLVSGKKKKTYINEVIGANGITGRLPPVLNGFN